MHFLRLVFLVGGLSLFGAFAIVMTVYYLLPFDPMRTEPLIQFGFLFWAAFIAFGITLLIGLKASKRLD